MCHMLRTSESRVCGLSAVDLAGEDKSKAEPFRTVKSHRHDGPQCVKPDRLSD